MKNQIAVVLGAALMGNPNPAPAQVQQVTVGVKSFNGTGLIATCRKQLKKAGLTNSKASKKIAEWLKGSDGNLKYLQAQSREFLKLFEANRQPPPSDVQKQLTTRPRAKRKKGRRKSNKPRIIYSGFESSRRRH